MAYTSFADSQFMQALAARDDLDPFNENKIAAFGIELCFGIDDPIATLMPAVTGGGGDAKIDILYVNRDMGIIVVCQAYQSQALRISAKGNKGTDLGHAMAVLLSTDEADLPAGVSPHILDARDAIRQGSIRAIHVWYIHNCPESKAIQSDMALCVAGVRTQLDNYGDVARNIALQFKEVGLESLDNFYRSSSQAISVADRFQFDEPRKGFMMEDGSWKTFITTVNGEWLANLYRNHVGEGLYDPNVRGFMGANNKDSDKIINAGIQMSAQFSPHNFFVFNNGITALVHDFELNDNSEVISITGIGIVNGAQTTGSLGELESNIDLSSIEVGVRFIKCEDKETVKSITKFNNSQNKVIQSDFRANDNIQTRLREEFRRLSIAEYDGGLRGHVFTNKKNKIDSHTAAQALTAWHGNPYDSYHNKMQIWELDEHYKVAFNETISAQHILFVYSLNEAANILKSELQEKSKTEQLMQDEGDLLLFLNERGSAFMTVHAMSGLLETLLNRRIISPYKIGFDASIHKEEACNLWKELLKLFARYISMLKPGVSGRLSNKSEILNAKNEFIRSAGTIAGVMQNIPTGNPYEFFIGNVNNEM
ncbi:AIPR family protein [Citrobacter portucalensis]|nr:AIPR family protein [Citrobacter portucalensis]MDN4384800.1 AIPR family protein [Citrobacter portucalensis]MDN4402446.1 AIPR family protein [Citrobacter portucalensis]MDN4444509.1 AIPR family protein [Citrobacter portucalensis]